MSLTTMATHGPDRSGSGPGVPVPKSTTLVIGDVLYAESGRAVPVVIKSDAAATTNGRGHPARRFATILTGPSLANLWGRKAGGLSSFERYSDALKSSGIIWDDRALDGWLTDPERMVPDNEMPFQGIKDARSRSSKRPPGRALRQSEARRRR